MGAVAVCFSIRMEAEQSLDINEIDMGTSDSMESNEIEMEMVPSEYVDTISCEFSYDPVWLPMD